MEKFAFLIHPIEIEDIYRKYKLLRKLPNYLAEKVVSYASPSEVSHITGVVSSWAEAEGWFIGVPLTSKMMMTLPEKRVIHKIIKAGKIAERLGANIVGLGAYTSVVGDGGITVAQHLDIAVTTGNTYTVAAAFEGTKRACHLMGKRISHSEVAIVGANGSIGRVCAELACREGKSVVLVGRDENKLKALRWQLIDKYPLCNISYSTIIERAIKNADVVITVTSSIEDVIKAEYIKPGAIVCDVARPRDVSKIVQEKRRDVLVIEGGVIQVPREVNFNFNFGFPKGLSYACMAETMILALEKRYENFSLGREIKIENVDEINRLAQKHGFQVAGLRSFERVIDERDIENILVQAEKAGNA